jgi:biotin carboxylase
MSILILHKKNLSRRRHLAQSLQYAREHDQRLLLVMKDPTWEEDFADRIAVADTSSIDETVAAVRALSATESEPITAVVSFAEAAVPAVARVAAALGLPGVSERSARLARDKYAMRLAFAAAGNVPQPRFGLARTVDDARAVARRTGYPLVLKPVLGTGSMYVRSVDDERGLREHFDFLLQGAWTGFESDPLYRRAYEEHHGALLIEEFVAGPEICVESLVVDGATQVLAIHDKPLPTGPTFEEVYACTPTRLPEAVVAKVVAATEAVHAALDIRMGASHVEFRLRDGEEPVILEAAARMGGGPIYRSVLLSTGVDMVRALLDMASGRRPVIRPKERPTPVGFWNIFPDRSGPLTAVHGLEEAQSDPRADEIAIYRSIGEHLAVPPQTFQGHGHLIFTADAQDQLDDVFDQFVKTVRLETTPEHAERLAQPLAHGRT